MTEEFEHPSEVPESEELMIDFMELASDTPVREEFDVTQPVVQLEEYRDFAKRVSDDIKRAPRSSVAAEEKIDDAELGAKFLACIEFDEEKAIERVRNKKWLIYGMLPHNDVGYIYGAPGSYKSFLALDIACHVASASKWNGIDVDYPGMVLYIAAEGGNEMHLRKKAWRIRTGNENYAVTILERSVMVNDAIDREQLKAAMREVQRTTGMKYVLVVIDTFSKCFQGNENDAADMRAFIAGCEDIRDSFDGCTVLFVGHTGKDNKDSMRGSSVALGDCGFSYRLKRGKERLYAELHTDKIKDASEPEDMAFEFAVVETGDYSAKGLKLTSLVPKMSAMLDRIDSDDKTPLGRAEKIYKPGGSERVKAMIMSQLRVRSASNGGSPENRMVIRGDIIGMLRAEDMNENTAKSNWKNAWDDLVKNGYVEMIDGDQWLPVKGK
jgi:KaiC/GvpD/RAD55 family RecA-like ATPase